MAANDAKKSLEPEKEIISSNFIQNIIDKDLEQEVYGNRVHTRFPPEPNGSGL